MDLLTKLLKSVKERFLTWHTGLDTQTREYQEWEQSVVNRRADYVDTFFYGFTHIIALDYYKVYSNPDPFYGHTPTYDFLSYMYPNREGSTDRCYYHIFRGNWENDRFYITDFGCGDQLFVGTNSAEDAVQLALRYA